MAMETINKVRNAMKSDLETVLASLSKEEYKAAMKALSNGKFSMKIPPLQDELRFVCRTAQGRTEFNMTIISTIV